MTKDLLFRVNTCEPELADGFRGLSRVSGELSDARTSRPRKTAEAPTARGPLPNLASRDIFSPSYDTEFPSEENTRRAARAYVSADGN